MLYPRNTPDHQVHDELSRVSLAGEETQQADDLQADGFAQFCFCWSLQHIFAFRWHSTPVPCIFLAEGSRVYTALQ